jgi:type III pantothenate kinase
MTLVCVVVQNWHTTVGLFDEGTLTAHWRLSTDSRRTADEWGMQLRALVSNVSTTDAVDGVAVCSAVPAVLSELRAGITDLFESAQVVVVGPGVRSGLPVLTDNPREVGTDRVANAIGAVHLVGAPCLVVDFGTATTFDVVNAKGEYVGGAIAPGVQLSLEALGEHAAQLRQVELVTPRTAIAKNTVEALQSGAVFGFAGQVDALVSRMLAELGLSVGEAQVIATGSHAATIAEHCRTVTRREPWLALTGLRVIFERNLA